MLILKFSMEGFSGMIVFFLYIIFEFRWKLEDKGVYGSVL